VPCHSLVLAGALAWLEWINEEKSGVRKGKLGEKGGTGRPMPGVCQGQQIQWES
jgi:hypothetical protein